jgi:hypothetical protein
MKTIQTKPDWVRYRFSTKAISDYRPLIFNPKYPWWCSGEGEDRAIIVAYLPFGEDLYKYWDDAFDITYTTEEKIEFTDRFPKPKYFQDADSSD